jgi:diguanylate cyclase (GGDEF)-like protein/PAS domain S-box-containing protein
METGSRKILFFSISLTLLIITIVYYSFSNGKNIAERYNPLVDATIEIRLEAAKAHLWFEQVASGEQTIHIDNVWAHIDQSQWYAKTMLDSGTNKEDTFPPLTDPNIRIKIEETIKGIHHFREIAEKRWSTQSKYNTGTPLDQQFDLAFSQLNLLINNVETALRKSIIKDLKAVKFTQLLLTSFIIVLGVILCVILLRSNTRYIKTIGALKFSEATVCQSQNQLLNVIHGAKLGYWDWDYETGRNIVNDEWLSILGLTRKDIKDHMSDWEDRIHPDDKDNMKKTVQVHIKSGTHYVVEFRMKHADGHWVWVQGSGSVVEYNQSTKEPLRLCGTHQDITERVVTDLREKSRTHVLELIASGEKLSIILEAIVRSVEQENTDMLCSILLLDDEAKHLLTGAAPSLPDFYNDAIHGIEIGVGVGSCGTAAFTNERVIVDDIQSHPYWAPYTELANKAELGACWSQPIFSTQKKVLGTFAIYHHKKHKPTEANINLIEQIAHFASIAIEQSKTNLTLKASEERFTLAMKGTEEGLWDWDVVTGKVFFSPRWKGMLGYKEDEIKNDFSSWELLIHPDDLDLSLSRLKRFLTNRTDKYEAEFRMRHKDGRYINILSRGFASENNLGKVTRLVGTHLDITKQKQLEEKLKLAASVFTHAREGIIITDASGNIIKVNDRFSEITGYSSEEVIGLNPRILKADIQSPEFYANMWHTINTKDHWIGELWNRHKSGNVYAEMKTISAVRDKHGVTTHYVALGNDITPMKEHQDQLEHIAHYDILTNLPNRVLLADRLSQAMLQCNRHGQSLAVVFLDLDGFKLINDVHGHDIGDELLIALSALMKEALREGDSLARIGGDEFVAVLADLNSVEDCEPVLERLLLAASEPVKVSELVLKVSASIGVTLYPKDNVDADLLMRHADQAMYVAKELGKNRYHLFDTAQDDAVKVQRESLEAIRSALDNQEFILYYQPKVNMRTGVVTGAEALIRWQHPERGLLNPIEFLPVIENNPMMIEMGEWVIDTVLTQISTWQTMGLILPVSTSVNIAAVQLQQPNFTKRLKALLSAHPDVEPCYLELEVLETSAIDDVQHMSTIMSDCISQGVKFALDDFGTGYSSLIYLRRLPANLIKIDQSFVRDMLDDADDFAIVEGVIALAKSFKREVIAEGVETIEHGTALLQLGCELAQGYGIARPMPANDIPDWIINWKPDSNWLS